METPNLSQTVAAAKAALAAARRVLNAALRDQTDTTAPRAELLRAQAALTEAEAAEQSAARAAREVAEAAERVQVAAAQEAAAVSVVEAIQRIDVVPDVVALPETQVDPAVSQAAASVARAEAELARALEAMRPSEAERDRLRRLVAEREAAEAAIRQRRLAGDLRDGDAAELHLAASDAADLRALVAEADARLDALRPSVELEASIERARDTLRRVRARAILDAQLAHVRRIELAFINAVRQLGAETQAHGIPAFNSIYTPASEIRSLVHGGRV